MTNTTTATASIAVTATSVAAAVKTSAEFEQSAQDAFYIAAFEGVRFIRANPMKGKTYGSSKGGKELVAALIKAGFAKNTARQYMGQLVYVAGKAGIPSKDIAKFTAKMEKSGLSSFRDIRAMSAAKVTKVAAAAPKTPAESTGSGESETPTPQAESHPLEGANQDQLLAMALTIVNKLDAAGLRRVAKAIEERAAAPIKKAS